MSDQRTLVEMIWKDQRGSKPVNVDMEALWQTIDELKDRGDQPCTRLSLVLHSLYRKDGSRNSQTLREVGAEIGVSNSRIQQNRDKAFAMLRNAKRRSRYAQD